MNRLKFTDIPGILKGKRILIACHIRPDGDALGSLCGMVTILRENGYDAQGILPESVPDYFTEFLPSEGLISEPADMGDRDFLIVLDSSRKERTAFSYFAEQEAFPCPVLNMDHHVDNPGFGTWQLICPDAAAASQIAATLAFSVGWKISREAANFLLIGIMTDTGGFRFSNTNAGVLRTGAALQELGAEYDRIIEACFFSKPEEQALFEAELFCRMHKECNGKYAWMYLEPALLEKYHIDLKNTEQVIENLRTVRGFMIVATLRNEGDAFKASIRSKDPRFSAGRIARSLGGGGHEMAAGCTMNAPSEQEAARMLLKQVEMELNEKQS